MILRNNQKKRTDRIIDSIQVMGINYPAGTPLSVILQAIADNQTVSLQENTLSIEGGNSVEFNTVELKDAFDAPLQKVLTS